MAKDNSNSRVYSTTYSGALYRVHTTPLERSDDLDLLRIFNRQSIQRGPTPWEQVLCTILYCNNISY